MNLLNLVLLTLARIEGEMRDYVAAAIKYYNSLGGEYKPSELEKKAAVFDSNMKYISSME